MRSTPNSRCAAVTGMCTSASRSTPKVEPTFAKTPMTRNRTPAIDTCRPSGSTSPNTRRTTVEPEHRDPAPGVDVGGGDVLPARQRPVEDVGHVLVDAVDGDERLAAPDADVLAGRDRHRDPALVADDPAEQVDVVEGQPADRRRRAELELARHDDDDVRAEALDLLLDLLLGAAAERHQDTTAATPMTTPSMVSALRSLLATQRAQRDAERLAGSHGAAARRERCPARSGRRARGCGGGPCAATSRSWVTTTTATPRSAYEPVEQGHDLGAAAGVEVAGRLVGQQQRAARPPGRARWRPAAARRRRADPGGAPAGDRARRRSSAAAARSRRSARRTPR